jgi:hypothetical protein
VTDPAAALTPNEVARIRLFRERIADLRRKGLVRGGSTKITVSLTAVASDSVEGLDEDHLASFLQTLRQFTLNDEPVHFYSIHNVIYRNCARPELRDWLVYARSHWKQSLATSPLGIGIDGHCPTVEEIMTLFLYGGMVHSDHDKAGELRAMHPPIRGILKMMLISGLGGLCHALNVTEKVLWHWLDAPEEEVPPFGDQP